MSLNFFNRIKRLRSADSEEIYDLRKTARAVRWEVIEWLERGAYEGFSMVDEMFRHSNTLEYNLHVKRSMTLIENQALNALKEYYITQNHRIPSKHLISKSFTTRPDHVKDTVMDVLEKLHLKYRRRNNYL